MIRVRLLQSLDDISILRENVERRLDEKKKNRLKETGLINDRS